MRYELNRILATMDAAQAALQNLYEAPPQTFDVLHGVNQAMQTVEAFHKKLKLSTVQRAKDFTDEPEVEQLLETAATSLSNYAEELLKFAATSRRALRGHLLCEELAEFLSAMHAGNELEMLDALGDLLYVLLGAAVTFDLPLAGAFLEIHSSNMTKEKQPEDPHGERVRSKGPNYRAPDLFKILAAYRQAQISPHLIKGEDCEHCGMSVNEIFKQIDETGRAKCTGWKL